MVNGLNGNFQESESLFVFIYSRINNVTQLYNNRVRLLQNSGCSIGSRGSRVRQQNVDLCRLRWKRSSQRYVDSQSNSMLR